MEMFDLLLGIQGCPSYGLGRLTDEQVTSEISTGASEVLNNYWNFPIGTQIPFKADGKTYVGRIELHYHPYGGTITPYGYHHGVSVLYFESDELMSGSEFLHFSESMTVEQREDYILLELGRGNIPDSISQRWVPLTVFAESPSATSLTIQVLPDYLAIGSDIDFVRVPCAAYTAQKLGDLYNASVPTTKLVDIIWSESTDKVEPKPLQPTSAMCRNVYIELENELIEGQLINSLPVDRFVGGDKKDTVLTNQYEKYPDSVAEYGWHQLNGEPIQPLYLGHSSDWADYSMGIRLVSNKVLVNGSVEMSLSEALTDEQLACLISDEGVIRTPRIPINTRPAATCWTPPED